MSTNIVLFSFIDCFQKELLELLRLVLACEETFDVRVHRLMREAVRLPLGVFVEDKIRYFLCVRSCQTGIGLSDHLCETLLIASHAQNRLFYTKRLKELRRHNAVRAFGCAFLTGY